MIVQLGFSTKNGNHLGLLVLIFYVNRYWDQGPYSQNDLAQILVT